MTAVRSRPEDFLEFVRRGRQGRLKVFLGPAPGVGKTYRMLQEARQLRDRGVDVVIGVVDAHDRLETARLTEGLPQVPLRSVAYRGVESFELDVEALKRRAPEVALVDEVARANAPGNLHKKRYEDVLELLRAGIHVYSTVNIQHLESLNDVVRRAVGIKVHETIPDSFLRRADQIVNIDLPPDDLLERLRAGKIYPESRIEWALGHTFRVANLEALRELALREVAESIGRSQRALPAGSERNEAAQAPGGRLMLGISSNSPRVQLLLRRASRMAGRLNVHWYVVYVETPREDPARLDADTRRRLFDAQQMARELGAEVHQIQAEDPVDGMLEFARANGVTDIVIGVTGASWLKQLFGATVPQRLLKKASGFDLHLFSAEEKRS